MNQEIFGKTDNFYLVNCWVSFYNMYNNISDMYNNTKNPMRNVT